ncbi:restriction endonuclease subunit S [Frankia sp. QA3]|uniref:restriction endonuclease subunit S n=1 Tax=Frankia sp. QA3 TaxID=710111 RepID=UPI000269C468|nr:restriction endonuclease subunit S [Frankia sp. QA3]EIV93877.1 hypothetical protein FraQA3DRAFT_3595 [Frankia sp. QA3]
MDEWPRVRLGDVTRQIQDQVSVEVDRSYSLLGVKWYTEGPFLRETVTHETSKATRFYRVSAGQFIYNRLFAWKGSFGLVGDDLDGSYVSNEFPLFECDRKRLLPEFLLLHFRQPGVWNYIERVSTGTTASRNRWKEAQFNVYSIALPPLAAQRRIVDLLASVGAQLAHLADEASSLRSLLTARRAELFERSDVRTVPVRDAFSVLMGRQRAPQHATGPYMTNYLRSANVGDGSLDLTDIKQMNFAPAEQEKFALQRGDVLVSEGSASPKAVGFTAVWNEELPGVVCFQKTLLRFRSVEGVSTSEYTHHWCQWAFESGTFLGISSGTNIKHITAVRVLDVPVALPTIEDQTRTAAELDVIAAGLSSVRAEAFQVRAFRAALLSALLAQEIEIPVTYDSLLEEVA